MEQLLRLSGLLGEEDDRTDLGTLEKRLAEKGSAAGQLYGSSTDSPGAKSTVRSESPTPFDGDSQHDSGSSDRKPSVQRVIASPKSQIKMEKKSGEVEALSETMCSLVMNNCGEARYIGPCTCCVVSRMNLILSRLFIRLLDLLAQRHRLGQREGRQRLLPAHDGREEHGGNDEQVVHLEARGLWRHLRPENVPALTALE